jgi:hypothetical protein
MINGPDLISIQRLRLNRDFAYREIGILDALGSLPLQVAILDTLKWRGINGPDQHLI